MKSDKGIKKFNLSVPGGLAEDIDKNRALLGNLSEIFQQAVQARIDALENFKVRLSTVKFSDLTPEDKELLKILLG